MQGGRHGVVVDEDKAFPNLGTDFGQTDTLGVKAGAGIGQPRGGNQLALHVVDPGVQGAANAAHIACPFQQQHIAVTTDIGQHINAAFAGANGEQGIIAYVESEEVAGIGDANIEQLDNFLLVDQRLQQGRTAQHHPLAVQDGIHAHIGVINVKALLGRQLLPRRLAQPLLPAQLIFFVNQHMLIQIRRGRDLAMCLQIRRRTHRRQIAGNDAQGLQLRPVALLAPDNCKIDVVPEKVRCLQPVQQVDFNIRMLQPEIPQLPGKPHAGHKGPQGQIDAALAVRHAQFTQGLIDLPRYSSSTLIWWLTAEGETSRSSAALVKFNLCADTVKVLKAFSNGTCMTGYVS
uniref:Transcriptional regulator n=1 Tax=Steinernema glaseri TaxID=37863 RepID=A0A1I7Y9X7_9BILA